MRPTTAISSQLHVADFKRDLLAELLTRDACQRPHGLNRAALSPDQLADVGRRDGHFDQGDAAVLGLADLYPLRRVGERPGDRLDHLADARRHDADAAGAEPAAAAGAVM